MLAHALFLAICSVLVLIIREVTGFLFGLLFRCPHSIQLRRIQHDPECIVPAQIRMLFEDSLPLGA
jgi:hypothetical protein